MRTRRIPTRPCLSLTTHSQLILMGIPMGKHNPTYADPAAFILPLTYCRERTSEIPPCPNPKPCSDCCTQCDY
eukprot:1262514-Amorphochlora_amoeboformis.AAC.1